MQAFRSHWSVVTAFLVGLALLGAVGCAESPEAKKQKSLARGEQYLRDGKLNEAIIELRAALAVDRDLVPALHALGRAYLAKSWAADAARELKRAQTLAPDSIPIEGDLGRSLLQLGAWSDAEVVAQSILTREPANPVGFYLKAAALLGQGKTEDAQHEIAAMPREALTPEIEVVRGQLLLRAGDVKQAEQAFLGLLASDPKQVQALLGLGRISLLRRDPRGAAKLFEQAKGLRPTDPEVRLGLAEAKARTRNLADAIKELEGIELRARNPAVTISLARYYLFDNRPAEMVPLLAPIVERAPEFAPARELLAQAHLANKKPDLAALQYQELIRQAPAQPGYQFGLARARLQEGRGREALAALDAAKPLDKLSVYHTTRASALMLVGRPDEALRAAETARRLAPASSQPYMVLAQIQFQQGNTKAARELLGKAAELDSTSAGPHLVLGRLHSQGGDLDAALGEFEAALAANPSSLAAVRAKAATLVQKGQSKEAIQFVESAVRNDPKNAGLHTLVGTLHAAENRVEPAVAAWRRAVDLDPRAIEPRIALARLAASQGKDGEAVAQLQAAVKAHPDHVASVLLLVSLYEKQAQYDVAISVLEPAVKAQPRDPALALALGQMHLRKGRHDDVIARMSDLLAQSPQFPPARIVRGQAYLAKGDGPAAVKDLTEAVRLAPKSAVAQYHLARSLVSVGQRAAAQSAYRQAIALDPRLERAKAELRVLSGEKPDVAGLDKDIARLQGVVKSAPDNLGAREQLARGYVTRGRFAEAEKELKVVLERAPAREQANITMAGVLFALNRPDDASGYLQAALKTNPSNIEANVLLARYVDGVGRREEALGHLQAALKTNPNLGGLYPRLGDLKNALTLAQDLERREPRSPAPPTLVGWVLLAQKNATGSTDAFRRALRVKPDFSEAHRGLAHSLEVLGQPDGAIESYRQAIRSNPSDVTALNNLAVLLSEVQKRPDEALPLAARAADIVTKERATDRVAAGLVVDTLGWVQYRRGAYPDAERALVRAAQLAPNSGPVHFHLGVTQKRLGKKAEAIASLRRAAELSPDLARTEKIPDLLKEMGG